MQEHMQKLQTWSSSQTYAPQVVFDFHSLKSKRPASELKHKVATRSWLLINPSLAPPYRMPPWLQSLLHLCLFFLSARLPGASYYGQFRSSQGEDAQYLILQVRFICQLPNRSWHPAIPLRERIYSQIKGRVNYLQINLARRRRRIGLPDISGISTRNRTFSCSPASSGSRHSLNKLIYDGNQQEDLLNNPPDDTLLSTLKKLSRYVVTKPHQGRCRLAQDA